MTKEKKRVGDNQEGGGGIEGCFDDGDDDDGEEKDEGDTRRLFKER
jgi:hypothetical protein